MSSRTPTWRPDPPSGPSGTGGTRLYPPPRGGEWCACLLVPPRGALIPQTARPDRRDSGVVAAVWGWMVCASPRTFTGRPYRPSGQSKSGGTWVYPPLCGGGWCACLLVPPRRAPIPQAARARLERLGCIRRCVGVDGVRVSWYLHGAPLCPKRPKQDRRDLGVSAAVWRWMGIVHTLFPLGASPFLEGLDGAGNIWVSP